MVKTRSVDDYLSNKPEWLAELRLLRQLVLDAGLTETIKWGAPVYTLEGKNVVGLAAFKQYVGLWFFQGVFIDDRYNVLVNAQTGKTKGMRQWRFQSADSIDHRKVIEYVQIAIENQRMGKAIKPDCKAPVMIPFELEQALQADKALQTAFSGLTMGKQREFADHIAAAKRPATRLQRLEKSRSMILQGIGLNERQVSKLLICLVWFQVSSSSSPPRFMARRYAGRLSIFSRVLLRFG